MQWDSCVKKIIPIGPFGWRTFDPYDFLSEIGIS
jgi:hypothetical protein